MSILARLLRAETVKWRKSWILVAAVLGPVVQVGNLLMVLWFSESLVRRFRPGFAFWVELNYLAWNVILLPILVALICDLSWEQELEARSWNHLLAQPVPREGHFYAKAIGHLALVLLAQAVLLALLIPGGFLLRHHLGDPMGDFPWATLVSFAGFSILASVPLVAFHTWLSARFPGLGVAILSGLLGSLAAVKLAGSVKLACLIPWGMTGQAVVYFDRWHRYMPWLFFPPSWTVAALLFWLGAWDFGRDQEPRRGG